MSHHDGIVPGRGIPLRDGCPIMFTTLQLHCAAVGMLTSPRWWERSMALLPGDRSIICVSPWPGHQPVPWSCSRCPEKIDVGKAWRVRLRQPDGSTSDLVVGPLCARELMPVRATIALAPLDSHESDLAPLVSLVRYITTSRRDPPLHELRLRAADVHLLAEVYDESPVRFAMRLRDAGVLIGL